MRLPIFTRTIKIVSTAIAIASGLIVTVGYFLQNFPEIIELRVVFVDWAIQLATVALLVGVINLLRVHLGKVGTGGLNAVYSLVTVVALVITFGMGLVLGPDHPWPLWLFNHVQVPIETSLMALLAIALAYASARVLSRRLNLLSVLFVITTLVVLLGMGTFPWGEIPGISDLLAPWLMRVPAAAGARGILLGVALGTIATGIRVLMGVERPYGG
jgi:hypothetical protein